MAATLNKNFCDRTALPVSSDAIINADTGVREHRLCVNKSDKCMIKFHHKNSGSVFLQR